VWIVCDYVSGAPLVQLPVETGTATFLCHRRVCSMPRVWHLALISAAELIGVGGVCDACGFNKTMVSSREGYLLDSTALQALDSLLNWD